MNLASGLAASTLSSSAPPLKITKIPSPNAVYARYSTFFAALGACPKGRRKWITLRKSSENQSVSTVASSPTTTNNEDDVDDVVVSSASEVVRNFYGGINARDMGSVQDLIAENCVYEDLIFPRPFVGRKVIYTISFCNRNPEKQLSGDDGWDGFDFFFPWYSIEVVIQYPISAQTNDREELKNERGEMKEKWGHQ